MMVIVREKKEKLKIEEVAELYSRLANRFTGIGMIISDWSLLAEGIELTEAATPQDARRALNEISRCLADLERAERENQFDDGALVETYREELKSCSLYVDTIVGELKIIWSEGDPVHRRVPFGDTTNYKYVVRQLIRFTDRTNFISSRMNAKIIKFNKSNKNLKPLPAVPVITVSQKVRNLSR